MRIDLFASHDELIAEAARLLLRTQEGTFASKILTPDEVNRQFLARGLHDRVQEQLKT